MDYQIAIFIALGAAVLMLILFQTGLIATLTGQKTRKKKEEKEEVGDQDIAGEEATGMILTVTTYVVFSVSLGIATYFLNGKSWRENSVAVLVVFIGYTVLSIRVSKVNQVAALLFLGRPLYELTSGPHFVPFGFFTMPKEKRTVIQRELPDEPEKVWYGDGNTPEGKIDPLRIPTGEGDGKSDYPLDNRMTLEPVLILRFQIKRHGKNNFIHFLETIESINGDEGAVKQLKDTAVRAVTEEFSSRTPRQILSDISEIQKVLLARAEEVVGERCRVRTSPDGADKDIFCDKPTSGKNFCEDPDHKQYHQPVWGIDVLELSIKIPGLSHTVNKAMRDVSAALYNKKTTITKAEAEQVRLTKEGLGEAAAKQAIEQGILVGRAGGLKQIAADLEITDGALLVKLETMRQALEKANHTIIAGSGGMSDILNMAVAIQKSLGGSDNTATERAGAK